MYVVQMFEALNYSYKPIDNIIVPDGPKSVKVSVTNQTPTQIVVNVYLELLV